MLNNYVKYLVASSAYCALRKPIVLQNHKMETTKTKFSTSYKTLNEYRPLLYTEIIPITLLSAIIGPFTFPLFFCQDAQFIEIMMRKLEDGEPTNKNHRSIFDLIDI